jgi:hypothetical protein
VPPDHNHRNYAGLVGVILATCLGVGWTASVILATLSPEGVGEEGLQLLRTVGTALAGALGAYLGVAWHNRKRNGEP